MELDQGQGGKYQFNYKDAYRYVTIIVTNLVTAAMAIEEACALSVLLPRGTQRSEIDERLALYEQIRDERPHKIQEISRKSDETLDRDSYNTQPCKYSAIQSYSCYIVA